MRRFFLQLLFSLAALPSLLSSSTQTQASVPSSAEAMEEYVEEAKQNILQTVDELLAIPHEEKTFQTVMKPWDRLGNDPIEKFRTLTYLTDSDLPEKNDALEAMDGLKSFVVETLFQNGELYRSLLGLVKRVSQQNIPLTPYERYYLYCLLDGSEMVQEKLTRKEREEIIQLKTYLAKHKIQPYIYLESSAPIRAPEAKFSVLTLNTCFVPGKFPFLFGGVSLPWQKRVGKLKEKILQASADVVCLQEVYTEEASYALYEALKDTYRFFYGAIGPRPLNFSLRAFGLPSGLFVASKVPIENPQFTPFVKVGVPVNYGFFDFTLKSQSGRPLAHLYTTHLQALDTEGFAEIRAEEFGEILKKMQKDVEKEGSNLPFFLCGDLNIPYGSKEPGRQIIEAYFYDAYNKEGSVVCASNRTCTDYFSNYLLSKTKTLKEIDPNFQILDYTLVLRSLPGAQPLAYSCRANAELLLMNSLDEPDQAISDHHGLLVKLYPAPQ